MSNPNTGTMENAPWNWTVTLTLGLTFLAAITVVPWYGIQFGFSAWAWIFARSWRKTRAARRVESLR